MSKGVKILIIVLSITVVGCGVAIPVVFMNPKSSNSKEQQLQTEDTKKNDEVSKASDDIQKDEKQEKEEKVEQVSQDEWLQAYRDAIVPEDNPYFYLFYFSKNSLVPYCITGSYVYHYEDGSVKKVVSDIAPSGTGDYEVYVDDAANLMIIDAYYNWYGGCTVLNTDNFEVVDDFRWEDNGNRDTSSNLEYSSMGNAITSYDYEQKWQSYDCHRVEKCILGDSLTSGNYSFYYDRE